MISDAEVIDAVHEHRACGTDLPVLRATCEAIAAQVGEEVIRLTDLLSEYGVSATVERNPAGGGQLHSVVAAVNTFAEACVVSNLAAGRGYVPWQNWTSGAAESFGRTSSSLTMARADDVTYVLEVRWVAKSRVPSALRPTAADWRAIELPTPLWPAYFLVRPVRLVAERLGLRRKANEPLGPILSTPASLIDPLLDFAAVDSSDLVVDLGCGDGRLVIEAARRRGCRAVGVENDPRLVDLATAAVAEAGLADLVDIVASDATEFDVSDASVVLLFLPAEVTAALVPELLARPGFGGRIVAHEQLRIDSTPTTRSAVLVGTDALTVAHQWSTATPLGRG